MYTVRSARAILAARAPARTPSCGPKAARTAPASGAPQPGSCRAPGPNAAEDAERQPGQDLGPQRPNARGRPSLAVAAVGRPGRRVCRVRAPRRAALWCFRPSTCPGGGLCAAGGAGCELTSPARRRRPRPGAADAALRLARGRMEQRLSAITLYCAPAAAPPSAMEQEQQHSNGDRGFENVELGIIGKKKKIPRRVIHFASGETMEEYSTDEEEDDQEKKDLLPPIDPTTLTWGPYLWFQMLRVATSTLSVCDFLGEKIASVLGISTPKYQYAIDEYYRMKKEEEEEEEENKMSEEAERRYQDQQNKSQDETPVQTDQPEATSCSSFVNLNFETEGDCQSIVESKQDLTPVPT